MTWKTHVIGGAQAGVLLAYANSGTPVESSLIIGAALVGSVLPDIDHTRSRICRSDSLAGLISFLLSKFTKHRGFTHTIFGALSFALIFYGLAVFKTEKESLASMAAAVAVFGGIHAFAGALKPLAGWLSALSYTIGPQIASLATAHNVNIDINPRAAFLCSAGIFAGCISHMLYDTANKGGVPWLWPISKRNYRILDIRTNTFGEIVFNGAQMFILAGLLIICFKDAKVYAIISTLIESLKEIV